jgi:hypothetical protein
VKFEELQQIPVCVLSLKRLKSENFPQLGYELTQLGYVPAKQTANHISRVFISALPVLIQFKIFLKLIILNVIGIWGN